MTPSILLLPGIGNSGLGHWQTIWAHTDASMESIGGQDWNRPVCTKWVENTTREEFQKWWLHEHASVVTGHTGGLVKRYVQLHSIGPTEPSEPFYHPDACKYDGVSLLNFTSLNDLEDFLRSDDYLAISKDEQLMIDTDAGEWWTSIGMTIVNRIIFEKTTSLDDFRAPFDFFKTL